MTDRFTLFKRQLNIFQQQQKMCMNYVMLIVNSKIFKKEAITGEMESQSLKMAEGGDSEETRLWKVSVS